MFRETHHHEILEGMAGKSSLNCRQIIVYEVLIKFRYLPCDLNSILLIYVRLISNVIG
jgi:hypothetical protein